MRHDIVYLAHFEQIDKARSSIVRLNGVKTESGLSVEGYRINHWALGQDDVYVYLLSEPDFFIAHLRTHPIDLLIVDERVGGFDALKIIKSIKKDVASHAQVWGPDFNFTMGRVVTILNQEPQDRRKIFKLGRESLRDILVAPGSVSNVLKWIVRLLNEDKKKWEHQVGCAMSGGGSEGFLFQLGTSYALEQAFLGTKNITNCDFYSGISSGSLVTTGIAGGVPLSEMIGSIKGTSKVLPHIKGKFLFDLAFSDIVQRVFQQGVMTKELHFLKWRERVFRSIPTGFFKGENLKSYVKNSLELFGCKDEFSSLKKKLFIGATDQDSFEHVIFGKPPFEHIPISEAVRGSCALPPFFTPITIENRNYIDGMITKTCNMELLIKKGCHLIIIIDPVVPFSSWIPGDVDIRGGFYSLIQTIKSMVHSRFLAAIRHYETVYPHVEFVVFQPQKECAMLMAGLPMKYHMRSQIINLAYQSAMRKLRERYESNRIIFSKFGFMLKDEKALLELEKKGI